MNLLFNCGLFQFYARPTQASSSLTTFQAHTRNTHSTTVTSCAFSAADPRPQKQERDVMQMQRGHYSGMTAKWTWEPYSLPVRQHVRSQLLCTRTGKSPNRYVITRRQNTHWMLAGFSTAETTNRPKPQKTSDTRPLV